MTEIIFNQEQRQLILQIARESGMDEIKRMKSKDYSEQAKKLNLDFEVGGVFVTYYLNKHLRGCIGCFNPTGPFYKLISKYAHHTINDYRFPKMTESDFNKVHIDVSCLSSPKISTNPLQEVVIGKHGIIVEYKNYEGTYLPEVATEMNWNTKQFLLDCAYDKAGIPSSVDVLNNPKVTWKLYTSTVTSDEN